MKDLIYYSLDINILVQSNATEKRLFNRTVEVIDYYCPVKPPTSIELIFLWPAQLSLLVNLSIDLKRTKNKSPSNDCDKSICNISDRLGGEELVMKEELVTKKELLTEEKLKIEEEIEMKDLEGPE